MSFNLIYEKWIPVLYSNGAAKRINILQAFEDAHLIRQIAASNPMDRVALLRFLSAVLMWCRENVKSDLTALVLKNTGVPEDWLIKLKDNRTKFELLGDGNRFYQDESVKNNETRPVADLLVEFPGADSVNHMRHIVHDGSYGFCPACCALGILRLSVWAPANRYYPASVNPGSAAYAFIEGKNLFQTLRDNLPETNSQTDQAPWISNEQPIAPDAVAMFAWRPRKLWLNVGSEPGSCANCVNTGTLVTSLCNEAGWSTPLAIGKKKKYWEADPQLLKKDEPIALPGLGSDISAHSSRFWRNVVRLRPEWEAKIVAIGPVVNKFTFQDALAVNLISVSSTERNQIDHSDIILKQSWNMLKRVTQNSNLKHNEIYASIALLTPQTENKIRAQLNSIISDSKSDDVFLKELFTPMFELVIAATISGSPIRRRTAKSHAQNLLNEKIRKLLEEAAQPLNEDAATASPGKTKPRRKNGDHHESDKQIY